MNKFVRLMLCAAAISMFTGCASEPAPVDTGNADAQRSRAEKAQSELDTNVDRQKAAAEKHKGNTD